MDIIEGVDEIKKDLESVEGISDKTISKLDELKTSSKKVISSLKDATSESEDRKKTIKSLNSDIEELNSKVDSLEETKDSIQEKLSDKTSRVVDLETKVKEFNLSNRNDLKAKLKKYTEHEKFDNINDFLKFEKNGETELSEVIENMDDGQVAHDLSKIKEYEAAGLFAEGTKQNSEQFSGGTDEDNLIEEIRKATTMDELNKVKRKVEKNL